MAFWSSWQQWEKLSLILVMLYAYCVLLYNNWRVRRYAVTEARQKEGEAELYLILTLDDVPFGARALKRGVHVEGIWVANFDSPSPSPSLRPPVHPLGAKLRVRCRARFRFEQKA
ncbi:hypothetical protein N7470_009020 [Penicillium chermesinum]|nr:hypothetical protein N7470_009020 [Penicillium chermesinum]